MLIKSLGKPLPSFKVLALTFAVGAASSMAVAEEKENDSSISALARQGLEMMQNATEALSPEDEAIVEESLETSVNATGMFPELEEIAKDQANAIERGTPDLPNELARHAAPDWLKKQLADIEATQNEPVMYLFTTRAMPELELIEMMREASGRHLDGRRVVMVLKGIYEDETVGDALKDLHAIIKKADLDHEPNVIIDPTLFQKFGVRDVPEMIYARGDNALIRATGTFAVNWMLNEYENNGRTGDIGNYGGTYIVHEVDLIELMQRKVGELDLASKRQEMVDNYWKKKTFPYLPPAQQNNRFMMDPTVIVRSDVVAPDGTVVAKRGDKFNPLYAVPFPLKVIVFDARDTEQVLFVADKVAEYDKTDTPIQLISSGIDSDRGWEHLRELDERFGHPVYLLTTEVSSRFNIQMLPSIVEADDRYFYVNQYAVSQPAVEETSEGSAPVKPSGEQLQALTVEEMEKLRKEQEQSELKNMFKRGG